MFFEQWLYKPGALKLNGSWQYDARKREIKITLDQVQTDGSIFVMPVQIAVYGKQDKQALIKSFQMNEKANVFTLPLDSEPEKIVLDPNSWVLMEGSFGKR